MTKMLSDRLSYSTASNRTSRPKYAYLPVFFQEDCKVTFFTAKDAKSAKEMLAMDIS